MLERLAVADPRARRLMEKVGRELTAVAERAYARVDYYGASYFGEGRDPSGDRAGCSGYATYDRLSSNADVAGFVVWRTFGGARRTLDVGCATGFVVEVLRELGVEAEGCDVSRYAIEHAAPGARGHVRVGDVLAGLPWEDGTFDVVSALETLEHLPPEQVPAALAELARVCSGFVYATIPSFGANGGGGPDGIFEGKVRPERLADYRAMAPEYEGPVPFADLARDAAGEPIEGHLTIAAYRWWTARFAEAGLTRRADVGAPHLRRHRARGPGGRLERLRVRRARRQERARRAPVAGVLVGGARPAAPAVRHLTGAVRGGSAQAPVGGPAPPYGGPMRLVG